MRHRRQLSPNQTALWTVYELIDIQARRSPDGSTLTYRVHRADPDSAPVVIVRRVVERLRQLVTAGRSAVVSRWLIQAPRFLRVVRSTCDARRSTTVNDGVQRIISDLVKITKKTADLRKDQRIEGGQGRGRTGDLPLFSRTAMSIASSTSGHLQLAGYDDGRWYRVEAWCEPCCDTAGRVGPVLVGGRVRS